MKFAALLPLFLVAASVSAQNPEPLSYEIRGDTVLIRNTAIAENCAARFDFTVDVDDFSIVLTERDTVREKMRCICDFDLEIALAELPTGVYTALIRREYLAKFNYPADSMREIGYLIFNVVGTGAGVSFFAEQGDCHGLTGVDGPPLPRLSSISVSPNPVRGPDVAILLDAVESTNGDLSLFDAAGKRVALVYSGYIAQGRRNFIFDTGLLPSAGTYHVVLTTGKSISAGMFTFLR
jgi:hypothetical protein